VQDGQQILERRSSVKTGLPKRVPGEFYGESGSLQGEGRWAFRNEYIVKILMDGRGVRGIKEKGQNTSHRAINYLQGEDVQSGKSTTALRKKGEGLYKKV